MPDAGSSLLCLTMTFTSAAFAGGTLTAHAKEFSRLIGSGVYTFARTVLYRITNLYAFKMASEIPPRPSASRYSISTISLSQYLRQNRLS